MSAPLDASGENLLRDLAPQVLGAVIRRFHEFSAAKDAVQEALLAAALQWPREGVPDNPRGWLIRARSDDGAADQPGQQRIRTSGVPFRLPTIQERADRLDAVLHVLYLVFNEGYASSIGADLQRRDLANEAIRPTRSVHRLPPQDCELAGLLALMLLTDARRLARTGPDGELIPLDQQVRAAGTVRRSRKVSRSSATRCRRAPSAPISCRRRLRPCTTKRRAPRTRSDRRSWRCTDC